jgi:hypothetical protein
MRATLLSLTLLFAGSARADDPATPPPEPPVAGEALGEPVAPAADGSSAESPLPGPVASASDRLERAKSSYFAGNHDDALVALRDLAAELEPAGEDDVRAEVLAWLGEIQFVVGDRAASWETYEALVRRWPDYTLSAFHHPAEVVEWFDLVRRQVRPAVAPVALAPPPLPAWGYAPLGIPQLRAGRAGRGVAFATVQIASAGASVGLYAWLAKVNGPNHPPSWPQDDVSRRVNQLRWGAQFPATAVFWATYALSVWDARAAWRREHAGEVTLSVRPGGLSIAATFGTRRRGRAVDIVPVAEVDDAVPSVRAHPQEDP